MLKIKYFIFYIFVKTYKDTYKYGPCCRIELSPQAYMSYVIFKYKLNIKADC